VQLEGAQCHAVFSKMFMLPSDRQLLFSEVKVQIIDGFDILLDWHFCTWLREVNTFPALGMDEEGPMARCHREIEGEGSESGHGGLRA
jgi:hypothetical protein